MKIVIEYEVPVHLQDQALQAHDDGDQSWLMEIAFNCRDYRGRVE